MDVRPLRRNELGTAARLLGRAFDHDPVIGALWRDSRRRRLAFPALFRSLMYDLVDGGTAYGAFDEGLLTGAAVWVPPSALEHRNVRSRANDVWLRVLYPNATPQVFELFEQLAPHHPGRPHWYLAFVGVHPEAQSRGIGARLLAPVHEHADREQVPCYLETPFARTHPFYERLGYVVQEELTPVASAGSVWTMLREPQ